ncbi:AAA family ATPase [Clostridium grantii]|uniref:AAA domain-containing protein, putative AbiEii toxin, Type IV TA system n=1 Tax=Clostridium grantii DSM 8605 TaxID=1121316 RepID=A0A1M5WVH0_9CLOT|nr:AAA family ATPase [Clostridium grantii]SHH91605.1 AAA domain-containing protein, putative AbiEii toxin, Type IV TA system [Clostridium grantii DSM 8605]
MGIDNIRLKNITVFEELKMDFSKGINVIIGENGTGKTTLLKMIYAACEWSNETTDKNKAKNIFNYFNYGKKDINLLKSYERKDDYSVLEVISENTKFELSLSNDGIFQLDKWLELGIKSIFIPTTEMLSHSKGFLAMNQKYSMPFDATQIDIIVNAELPETREVSELNQKLLDLISKVIDGEVIYENDTFYVVKNNGMKVEFSFEAEGLRKFGLLWKLIRNGLIEEDTILFWDEPEANINPELMPVLIDVLLELQRNGIQIFIATHSYNLAKYFEIKRTEKDSVLFHNLYREKTTLQRKDNDEEKILASFENKGVKAQSSEYFGKITNNPIIVADAKLFDEVIEKTF